MDSAQWTDGDGRKWSVSITVGTIKRVQEMVDVNLVDVFSGTLLNRLAEEPVLLANTLYAVCKTQADERGIDDVAFGELLVGDTIESAAHALVQGITLFFPQQRRAILSGLWAKTTKAKSAMLDVALAKLESGVMDQAIQAEIDRTTAEVDRRIAEMLNPSGDGSGN